MGERKRAGITRVRADAVVAAVIREAEATNADPTMAHTITKLSVFGSYLGEKAALGVLDLAYAAERRDRGMQHDEWVATFSRHHPPPRWVACDWFQRIFWPEAYLARRLKVARGISLHEQSEVDGEGYSHRVLFKTG